MIKNFITRDDKLMHLLVNYTVVTVSKYLNLLPAGIILAIALSFGKELYDKYIKKTKFDWEDIQADFLGIIMGIL